MPAPQPVRTVLRRGVGARLFSGFWLQPILTAAVILELVLIGIVSSFATIGQLLPALPAGLVLIIVWGMGVTAHASTDAQGVRWRYFRVHELEWPAVEAVRFGAVFAYRGIVGSSRPAIFVRANGVEHPIVPAYDCARLPDFADALAGLAAAHGVPTAVDSPHWRELAALPNAERTAYRGPGRVVSHSLQRLRLRLTGVAFVAVAICGLVGASTGWEAHGVGPRVAFGVVGVVLLLVGVLLVAPPGGSAQTSPRPPST